MVTGLHDRAIKQAIKERKNVEFRDDETPGLRLRVFAKSGKATWSFRYRPRAGGGYKRVTVGSYPGTLLSEARKKATKLKSSVIDGDDPAAELAAKRRAETISELLTVYLADEIKPKKKPSTHLLYSTYSKKHVGPVLGAKKAHAVTKADVARLHRDIGNQKKKTSGGGKTATANRVLIFLSGAFSYAGRTGIVPDGFNPTRGLERFKENSRERFLSNDELARLGETLRLAETSGLPWPTKERAKHARRPENQRTKIAPAAVAAIRLLILTGCRLREILHLEWSQVDLARGFLNLADSKTGRKAVVLNAPAISILSGLDRVGRFVILGDSKDKPRADLKKPWELVRLNAKLDGLRIHDLRHSFASVGAGAGVGLPIIGKLLGHKNPETTAKYAHLADDPVRRASETMGSEIAAAMGEPIRKAEVVAMRN